VTGKTRLFWKTLERVINFAFFPMDGPNHCLDAYLRDKEERHFDGSDLGRGVLAVFVVAVCIPLSVFSRLWGFVGGKYGR
jgi:hypothetical protein